MILTDVKAKLIAERDRLRGELDGLAAEVPMRAVDEPGYGNHLADDATDTEEAEKTIALGRHLHSLLEAAEHALERLDAGAYGICEDCGRPINPERLEALPHATLCIQCKSKREKQSRFAFNSPEA